MEIGGQWPLTCFAPIKEGLNIPGWEDYSPEEIRWKMYEARNKGNLNQCINEIKQLYIEAEKKRIALKQPTIENINLISNLIKMRKESCAFNIHPSPNSSSTNNGKSIFGSSPLQTINNNQGFFSSSQTAQSFGNIFGGSQQNSGNEKNIFNENIFNANNKSIFGGSERMEDQNTFIKPQVEGQSLFSKTPTNLSISAQNQFSNIGSPNTENTFFNQSFSASSIFAAQSRLYPGPNNATSTNQEFIGATHGSGQNNVFGSKTPVNASAPMTFDTPKTSHFNNQTQSNLKSLTFAINQANQKSTIDHSAYSKTENLTPEELQAFLAATFTFGKIPMKPPPMESC